MLQTAVSIGHEIIQSSWFAASVLVKYYLIATLGFIIYREGLSTGKFKESILENSRIFVLGLGVLGVVLSPLGMSEGLLLPGISQVVAFLYLGYLFWVY